MNEISLLPAACFNHSSVNVIYVMATFFVRTLCRWTRNVQAEAVSSFLCVGYRRSDRRTVSSTTSGTAERNASRSCAGRERRVHSGYGYTVQARQSFSSARDVRCGGSASSVLWVCCVFVVVGSVLCLVSLDYVRNNLTNWGYSLVSTLDLCNYLAWRKNYVDLLTL